MAKIEILDTTLRDGSYAVGFNFTALDTAVICRELERAGIKLIEIGHGVGLSASRKGHGAAAETDEAYMVAAKNALSVAKWGMFCIPGIAELGDLDLAAKHHMGFIRIGTDANNVEISEPFIKKAKDMGMFVAANFMKSYVIDPKDFAKNVKRSQSDGADMVYLVDSAGGMFGKDVKNYFRAIREVSNIPLGFHGHDNLGLAIANCLEAAELGFQYVDASLQGLGRSSGNAATEVLALAFEKLHYETGVDGLKLLEAAHKYVRPFISAKGKNALDVIAGYADFHSSYMHYIQKYAAKYSVNPLLLIIEAGKANKAHVDESVLEAIAQKLQRSEDLYLGTFEFNRYIGREQDDR